MCKCSQCSLSLSLYIYIYLWDWMCDWVFGVFGRDLDENLQKAFHRFLEIRGIKPNITEFVADYLANKDSRERLQLLKDVKTFVDMWKLIIVVDVKLLGDIFWVLSWINLLSPLYCKEMLLVLTIFVSTLPQWKLVTFHYDLSKKNLTINSVLEGQTLLLVVLILCDCY